jgi:hypothetical protein
VATLVVACERWVEGGVALTGSIALAMRNIVIDAPPLAVVTEPSTNRRGSISGGGGIITSSSSSSSGGGGGGGGSGGGNRAQSKPNTPNIASRTGHVPPGHDFGSGSNAAAAEEGSNRKSSPTRSNRKRASSADNVDPDKSKAHLSDTGAGLAATLAATHGASWYGGHLS